MSSCEETGRQKWKQGDKEGVHTRQEPTLAWTEEQLVKTMKALAVGRKGKSVNRQKEQHL